MKTIPLTQGKIALVDDDDYPLLSKHKWHAKIRTRSSYARRTAYPYGRRNPITIMMHRVILGTARGEEVDHINGDGLDNRRYNLRVGTHQQNMCNQRKTRGTSRFKGVRWHNNQWTAQIKHKGRQRYLGGYQRETDAACAYDNAAIELFGECARLNSPIDFLHAEVRVVPMEKKGDEL